MGKIKKRGKKEHLIYLREKAIKMREKKKSQSIEIASKQSLKDSPLLFQNLDNGSINYLTESPKNNQEMMKYLLEDLLCDYQSGAVCADVRPVLREVFRENDQLPPLALEKGKPTTEELLWINKYNTDCKEICEREGELKKEFAKRISKRPQLNLYRLYSPREKDVVPWKKETGMIERADLMPPIETNAEREQSLWVQSILNRSSCDFSAKEDQDHAGFTQLPPLAADQISLQVMSYGDLRVPKPAPPPIEIPPPRKREYVICVPPQLDFVNFTVGQLHTHSLRLVNVSKFEVRISITPPVGKELDVEICSARGLIITAGAAAELKIHFRPMDVSEHHDTLYVRASLGRDHIVPIACYMQPPLLYIHVINSISYLQPLPSSEQSEVSETEGDILDLGSKLLGDVHYASLILESSAGHASFFLLTEDAWLSFEHEEMTRNGSLKTGPFLFHPAWWAGGGTTRGFVQCVATTLGLHTTALRILSSTAVARPLVVVADTLCFSEKHISIEAHEKNYDINSEDDPDCEYYVHLGTAFPNRPLSATIRIINHSPIPYAYYWAARPWGVCSCWADALASPSYVAGEENTDSLCSGAKEERAKGLQPQNDADAPETPEVLVEPPAGRVSARHDYNVVVRVAKAGERRGIHRTVLMLILKDVPKDSFSQGSTPMIRHLKTEEGILPGEKLTWMREICEVVCAQMEVWWEVVPVRFVLDPPVLPLIHSRRVTSVRVKIRATQLFGCDNVCTQWLLPPAPLPPAPVLNPVCSVEAKITVPLPALPNEYSETDIFRLTTDNQEFTTQCQIERSCATRHLGLAPGRIWLGVVGPGARVSATMRVSNHTHQHICWWATPHRYWGENTPSAACARSATACSKCHESACTCALLGPTRGALAHGAGADVHYNVNAPTRDRCVATLVQVQRTAPDTARVPGGPGTAARATLIAYRVLAPRLLLRAFPCQGDKSAYSYCARCGLDPGEANSPRGTSVLRPSQALAVGSYTCYDLRITNLTPIPTTVRWEKPIDNEEFLKLLFIPKDFDIGGYDEVTIKVILEARRVCGRRLYAARAHVTYAYKPLYLVIDAAIDGVKIIFDVPLGGEEENDAFVSLRGTQMERFPWDTAKKPASPMECFELEDQKRTAIQENICRCPFEMVYIQPPKKLRPPPLNPEEEEVHSVEIVYEPPPLTRICHCDHKKKPILPEEVEPYCLQYRNVPLRTVKSKRLVIRNTGLVPARWRMAVRRWPRHKDYAYATEALVGGKDRWAGDVRAPGVAVQCAPRRGLVAPGERADVRVQVYADCWGCYFEQLVLMVVDVAPIVIDIWIHAVGPPLAFLRAPRCGDPNYGCSMWMSASDPERTVRAINTSRSAILVHAYTLLEHEHVQDVYPFRLYLRFFDVLPVTCPCVTAVPSDLIDIESLTASTIEEEMDTGIELFLAADHGIYDSDFYSIEPEVCTVPAGAHVEWRVTLKPQVDEEQWPPGLLLLRTIPLDSRGDFWMRDEPAPVRVALRTAPRNVALRLSCSELRIRLCALDMPYKDVIRIRKQLQVQNVGSAPLQLHCETRPPWCAVVGEAGDDCGGCGVCGCQCSRGERHERLDLVLEPRSSFSMSVEVTARTEEIWPADEGADPCTPPSYPRRATFAGAMNFTGQFGFLQKLPLVLEVEFPQLFAEPAAIDFGFVTDGDTCKTYFTVWHSSTMSTIDLSTKWLGGEVFKLYPRHLRLAPAARERIYLQYTAKWSGSPVPAEGCVSLTAAAGAGAWCRAALPARACPARDHRCKLPVHDYTDDTHLKPPTK